MVAQEGPFVYRQEVLGPKAIWQEDQSLIVDFGQVIAGRVRLQVYLVEGQEIVLDHAEVLDHEGRFFKNIIGRNKDARDIFIGRGQREVLEPDFTFHGFRYLRLRGMTKLDPADVQAIALYSDMEATGSLTTSDPKVNQLLSNIHWSQKGNMVSIPTDCPQRERVGWTGDMQVFAPSSTFFMHTQAFIRRWLKSVRSNQQANGEIVDYSPMPADFLKSLDFTGTLSSAGWGDAIIMVPWVLYQRYGDLQVLEENYEAMVKWHTYCRQSAGGDKRVLDRYIWDTKFHYGDWMFPSYMMEEPNPMRTAQATKDLVATAFLAHSADLLGQIAAILGKESQDLSSYASKVRKAFTHRFVTAQGHLTSDFQGCYVLALAFDMVPDAYKQGLVDRLVEKIHQNGDRLDTGFLSVPYLLDVLCDNGQKDLARTLFFQEACPSWFYEVNHGATTIWESWAGISPDGRVGSFSFNQYAFGCVLDWMIRQTVGLNPTSPGYQSILIQPRLEIVEDFQFSYQTAYGHISIDKSGKNWNISVAPGIHTTIDLSQVAGVLEG